MLQKIKITHGLRSTNILWRLSEDGVKRYQVAGLLQVGNEDGPVSGELGYDQDVPNASVQIRWGKFK